MSEWKNYLLESAIKKKLPEWHKICGGYDPPGPAMSILIRDYCPGCGKQTIFCCRNDFGAVDTENKFAHICVNPGCDYVMGREIQGVGFPDSGTRVSYCPWCS